MQTDTKYGASAINGLCSFMGVKSSTNVRNFSRLKTRESLCEANVSLDGASGINGLSSFMGV